MSRVPQVSVHRATGAVRVERAGSRITAVPHHTDEFLVWDVRRQLDPSALSRLTPNWHAAPRPPGFVSAWTLEAMFSGLATMTTRERRPLTPMRFVSDDRVVLFLSTARVWDEISATTHAMNPGATFVDAPRGFIADDEVLAFSNLRRFGIAADIGGDFGEKRETQEALHDRRNHIARFGLKGLHGHIGFTLLEHVADWDPADRLRVANLVNRHWDRTTGTPLRELVYCDLPFKPRRQAILNALTLDGWWGDACKVAGYKHDASVFRAVAADLATRFIELPHACNAYVSTHPFTELVVNAAPADVFSPNSDIAAAFELTGELPGDAEFEVLTQSAPRPDLLLT